MPAQRASARRPPPGPAIWRGIAMISLAAIILTMVLVGLVSSSCQANANLSQALESVQLFVTGTGC